MNSIIPQLPGVARHILETIGPKALTAMGGDSFSPVCDGVFFRITPFRDIISTPRNITHVEVALDKDTELFKLTFWHFGTRGFEVVSICQQCPDSALLPELAHGTGYSRKTLKLEDP